MLKGKFLCGKRNRRLDHLIWTLVCEVVPYYALKQRRQDLGFEGPDIEVKKRKNIQERSLAYVKTDIVQVDEAGTQFLVPSLTDPSRVYDVDLEAYTCTCLDYPLISFCKHICAVQNLFGEPNGAPTGLQLPSVPSLPPASNEVSSPQEVAASKQNPLKTVVEKLERVAARLRRPRKKDSDLPDTSEFIELEAALNAMLLVSDSGSVLPSAEKLAAVVKETARSVMMPNVKTRRARGGDAAYGGGASSGSKAKKMYVIRCRIGLR